MLACVYVCQIKEVKIQKFLVTCVCLGVGVGGVSEHVIVCNGMSTGFMSIDR